MAKIKKRKSYLIMLFFFFLSLLVVKISEENVPALLSDLVSFNETALADDENEEMNKEDDEYEEEISAVQASVATSSKPQTYTQVIKLPDQIVTKTIIEDVVLLDADKDGIADANDPHPTIPEHLIVSDANGNGIDDNYEIPLEDANGNGIADNYENLN